jgi:hypothetical protein
MIRVEAISIFSGSMSSARFLAECRKVPTMGPYVAEDIVEEYVSHH